MPSDDYQQQLARLKHWNRVIMGGTVAFMLLLFFGLTGYAIYQNAKANQNTQLIINELRLNREGGDINRCILTIPATSRTQKDINACYPGGDPAKYKQDREAKSNASL